MSDPSHDFYWSALPSVRMASIGADGTLVWKGELPLKYFGGCVPVVGDVVGTIWGDKDYDLSRVQERFLLSEFQGDRHWLLIVAPLDKTPHLDQVGRFSLLRTDAENAAKAGTPEKELIARIQQLDGTAVLGARKFRPKARLPDE